MRHFNSIVASLAASGSRFSAIATGLAGFTRRLAAAIRNRVIAGTTGEMNDRELQDVGLSRLRVRAPGDGFTSAEAQLGMVR